MRRSKDEIIDGLRGNGLRITHQLEAILEYLLSTDEHPSASKIYEAVKKKIPKISLATVYNTLSKLKEQNCIGVIEFDDKENRYEGDLSDHFNLICLRCNKIIDYRPVHTIDRDRISAITSFQVLRASFELYGICEACAKVTANKDKTES